MAETDDDNRWVGYDLVVGVKLCPRSAGRVVDGLMLKEWDTVSYRIKTAKDLDFTDKEQDSIVDPIVKLLETTNDH